MNADLTTSLSFAALPTQRTTHARFNISPLDKAALLWSIQNRQINLLNDSNIELIFKDFAIIRGSERLQVASKSVINQVFESKDSIVAKDALKKYLPQFKEKVTLKRLFNFIKKKILILIFNFIDKGDKQRLE